ncbi:hypothetical protein [Hymenobacter tenuis]
MATPHNPSQPTPSTPTQPATTQHELSNDTGEGIRGGYGDSDQTNGLEGGNQKQSADQEIEREQSEEE